MIMASIEVNSDVPPTQAVAGAWIYAETENILYPEDTKRSGKWLVFLQEESIDRCWMYMRVALAMYRFGRKIKSSTCVSCGERKRYVVCVYTYDYADSEDVMRIRASLRDLGIQYPITYKSNEQTRQGVYSEGVHGQKNSISFTPIYKI